MIHMLKDNTFMEKITNNYNLEITSDFLWKMSYNILYCNWI